jgi:hypothetical protein
MFDLYFIPIILNIPNPYQKRKIYLNFDDLYSNKKYHHTYVALDFDLLVNRDFIVLWLLYIQARSLRLAMASCAF